MRSSAPRPHAAAQEHRTGGREVARLDCIRWPGAYFFMAPMIAPTIARQSRAPAAGDTAAVRRVLDGVRAAGYALREPGIWPASNTLAVPVHGEGGVVASIGVTFFSSALTPAAAVERFLPDMQEAARDIGERLKMN